MRLLQPMQMRDLRQKVSANRIEILVFDYDGTLTLRNTGGIPHSTQRVLREASSKEGVILGIVSGRDLAYLRQVNNLLTGIFSFLVSENGAVTDFCDSDELLLRGRDWTQKARLAFCDADFPIHFFEIVASTKRINLNKVTGILRDKKLESKLAFNRDSIIVLPPGVDKGTGVSEAVSKFGGTKEVRLTCFGDGENDIALFGPADIGVAVSDAVDQLKKVADTVTTKPGGLGIEEYLVAKILKTLP